MSNENPNRGGFDETIFEESNVAAAGISYIWFIPRLNTTKFGSTIFAIASTYIYKYNKEIKTQISHIVEETYILFISQHRCIYKM